VFTPNSKHRVLVTPAKQEEAKGPLWVGYSYTQLTYALTDDGAEGDIAITRVLPGGQALCEELEGAD